MHEGAGGATVLRGGSRDCKNALGAVDAAPLHESNRDRSALRGPFGLYSSRAASAQTQAICKQEYAAKKAAGETAGQSQASFIKTCLARGKAAPEPPIKPAAPSSGGSEPATGNSDADLAKQLANPIASLISVPFQNNLD